MNIMRLLTRKIKSEALNDARSRWRRTFLERNDTMQATEFDSGTASDEDATEFEEELCVVGVDTKLNCEVMQTAQMQLDWTAECLFNKPNATSYSTSLISPHLVSDGVTASKDASGASSAGQPVTLSGRLSAVSSDFERCSLDFEPLSSSEVDHHSSEEELVSIYRHEQKRKRSQIGPDNQCSSGDEDEELEAERSLQDCDHRLPLSSSGHPCLHDNEGIPNSSGGLAARGFTSPRKRHRQTSINSSAIQRPSLDLYKMQKTSITRKHSSSSSSSSSSSCRPRVVKIRTISGSGRPAKSAYNPSVCCFRSISWASSRLKEEPFRAF